MLQGLSLSAPRPRASEPQAGPAGAARGPGASAPAVTAAPGSSPILPSRLPRASVAHTNPRSASMLTKFLAVVALASSAHAWAPLSSPLLRNNAGRLSSISAQTLPASLRLRPSLRSATSVKMLGNLFGGAPKSAAPEGTVVSKVFFDVEIGGAPAGNKY